MGPVTRTKPAAEVTQRIAWILSFWNATQMRTDTDDNEPFRSLNTCTVGLGVFQVCVIVSPSSCDFLWRTVINKYRLALPHDRNSLAQFDRLDVHFNGR